MRTPRPPASSGHRVYRSADAELNGPSLTSASVVPALRPPKPIQISRMAGKTATGMFVLFADNTLLSFVAPRSYLRDMEVEKSLVD
jgi:hypothetical protein